MIFASLLIVSLVLVFFVGRKFDPETGTRNFVFTTNGLSHFRKGLDVSGGTRLVYKISYDKYEELYPDAAEFAVLKKTIETIIMKNIDSRISKLGVSDYKAYVQNMDDQHYIVVEIGGIADIDQAKNIIGKTLELEFKLQNPESPTKTTIAARKTLANQIFEQIKANPDTIQQLLEGRGSENIYHSVYPEVTISQLPDIYKNTPDRITSAEVGKIYGIIDGTYTTVAESASTGVIQGKTTNIDGFTMFRILESKEGKDASGNVATLYTIEDVFVQDRETRVPATDGKNVLNGAYFKFANTTTSDMWEAVVVINLDDQGKEIFCTVTQNNLQKPMAIFVWGNLLTAPTIQTKICGGTAEINGGFTMESAKEMSDALNEWTLPAPLVLMQEEKISPSLWENALGNALRAGLAGFLAIMVLIYAMYGWRRMIVTGSVLISFLIVLAAFMKVIDYALSLSGIAVIILSIWMGVDANILIYERLNEELKWGKSMQWSIDTAKDRSRPAIRDGQISTGIIAFVLFSMGTNMFKWFGSMLIVTMFLTLFFNVPLTKILLHTFYNTNKTNN